MEEQNVAIRLKGFIDAEGLTHSQFADTCGIPRPSLSQIISGRNKKISDVIVGQIHRAFPDLSILWLMFGEGPMLVSESHKQYPEDNHSDSSFPEGNLFSENLNFLDDGPKRENKSNLSGLKSTENAPISSHYKGVSDDKTIVELQKQIEKLKKNPRKVSHITVYYDDSTFETFSPAQ